MKMILRYLKPYWLISLLAPLLMVLEVVMDLLQPKLMKDIVDLGIANGDMAFILVTGGKMVGVALLGIIGGFGCSVFSSMAGTYFGTDLRAGLFRKIQSFSFANLDHFKTSSLITRITNDVTQVQNLVIMVMRMMVRAPLLAIGGIAMMLSLNLQLSLILVVVIPLLTVLLVYIITKGFPKFGVVQQKLDATNLVIRENLSGVRVVKAFVREQQEIEKFDRASTELRDTTLSAMRTVMIQWPLMMLLMNVSIIAVLWFGAGLHASGVIGSGDIMAFIQYMSQILMALMQTAMMLNMLSRTKVSIDRIDEVLMAKADIESTWRSRADVAERGAIEFEDVSFHYPASTGDDVLSHLSFSAQPGETIGILGATGSGKSTLVSLIPRLYDVTGGAVRIDDIDVRDMDLNALRGRVGFVLQQSILFTGTIRENLLWGDAKATDEQLWEALRHANAETFVRETEHGLDTELEQMATNLSGGQKQRLSIARALVKRPSVLILDDSTSAVDFATEAVIQRALKHEWKACTKLIIAQRVSSVMDADKILILAGGEIVSQGTHEQLLRTSPIYQEIYRSQLQKEA